MSFMDKFTDVISIVAEKVDDNKYLSVIKTTFTIYMPFIIVGSFSLLFNVLLTSETTGLAQFEMFKFLTALAPAFTAVNFATMNIMTLAIVFIIGQTLGNVNKESGVICGLVALSTYVAVVPQSILSVVDGVEKLVAGLPVTSTNASGLFIGMILSVIVVELFTKLCKVNQLKIKMPPSVPSAIAKSFNALIPIFITLVFFSILGRLFVNWTGTYINEYIYAVLQAPLELIIQSPVGILSLVIISQLFWLVGIHGGLVISPIRNPLLIAALASNIAAVEAGGVGTQAVTLGFWNVFIVTGGAGLTLSLIIAIFIFSKREDHRMIAKLSAFPGIVGISEPIVFGLPLVLNPIFAIPFVFASVAGAGVALFASSIGFLTPNIIDVPFGLPLGVNAFLGFGINGIIVQVIVLIVGVLMYTPFVLIANKQKDGDESLQEGEL